MWNILIELFKHNIHCTVKINNKDSQKKGILSLSVVHNMIIYNWQMIRYLLGQIYKFNYYLYKLIKQNIILSVPLWIWLLYCLFLKKYNRIIIL